MIWTYIPSKFVQASGCLAKDCAPGSDTWASRIAPLHTLNGKHTPPASWLRAWKKAPWMRHLSGPTFSPSTASHGVESWIASLQDSRAKTSHWLDDAPGSMAHDLACSSTSSTLPTLAVRGACFWRTSQASLLPPPPLWTKPKGLSTSARPPASWENWPTAGGMRNGSIFQRPTWAPAMGARGGSAGLGAGWTTPTATERSGQGERNKALTLDVKNWATPDCNTSTYSNGRMGPNIREQASQWLTPNVPNGGRSVSAELVASKGMTEDGQKRTVGLESQVRYWPSPKAPDGTKGGPNQAGSKGDLMLPSAAVQWPTPACRDYHSPNAESYEARGGGMKGEQLNNYVAHHFSPLVQPTRDGVESLPETPTSRQHLNPLFGAWLMGWPSTWVIAEPHASSALETELWRSKLQQQLSCFFDEPDL